MVKVWYAQLGEPPAYYTVIVRFKDEIRGALLEGPASHIVEQLNRAYGGYYTVSVNPLECGMMRTFAGEIQFAFFPPSFMDCPGYRVPT